MKSEDVQVYAYKGKYMKIVKNNNKFILDANKYDISRFFLNKPHDVARHIQTKQTRERVQTAR